MAGFFTLRNPLPSVFKDNSDNRNTYDEFGLIPYRGNSKESSHSYLKLLYDLFELSPSQGSCINDIVNYAFSGDIDLVKSSKPGLKLEKSGEMNDSEKVDYCTKLESLGISSLLEIGRLSKMKGRHKKISGNSYLYVKVVTINGESKVSFKVYHTLCGMILKKKKDTDPTTIVLANDFTSTTLKDKDKRKLVRVYPDVNISGAGKVFETVFHLKANEEESDIYAMPDSLQTLRWQYIESALADLSCKISGTEFVAKQLLVMPGPDPATDGTGDDNQKSKFLRMTHSLRDLMTNEGHNAKSLGIIQSPFGSDMPELHNLEVNRDSAWFKCQMEIASNYIYAAHRHNKQLTGMSTATSNIGGNVIFDLSVKFNHTVVKPIQAQCENEWLEIMDWIMSVTGNEAYKGVRFKFNDNIKEQLKDLKDGGEKSINTEGGNLLE